MENLKNQVWCLKIKGAPTAPTGNDQMTIFNNDGPIGLGTLSKCKKYCNIKDSMFPITIQGNIALTTAPKQMDPIVNVQTIQHLNDFFKSYSTHEDWLLVVKQRIKNVYTLSE